MNTACESHIKFIVLSKHSRRNVSKCDECPPKRLQNFIFTRSNDAIFAMDYSREGKRYGCASRLTNEEDMLV
ncbi:hypothetical protein AB6A40_005274 [Gnathostoma spinigerum]|uniref:Uncharacterized protein n=1 Tax=Gnathostoma spinigerum TaxID=75299 RepID=A0ABD6EG34_9BILA